MPTSSPGRYSLACLFVFLAYLIILSFGIEIAKLKLHTATVNDKNVRWTIDRVLYYVFCRARKKIAGEIVKCIGIKYIQDSFKNMRSHMDRM